MEAGSCGESGRHIVINKSYCLLSNFKQKCRHTRTNTLNKSTPRQNMQTHTHANTQTDTRMNAVLHLLCVYYCR